MEPAGLAGSAGMKELAAGHDRWCRCRLACRGSQCQLECINQLTLLSIMGPFVCFLFGAMLWAAVSQRSKEKPASLPTNGQVQLSGHSMWQAGKMYGHDHFLASSAAHLGRRCKREKL